MSHSIKLTPPETRSLKLKEETWFKIKATLRANYPPSVLLSRSKMKEVLGFTDRETYCIHKDNLYRKVFCLDFFDEKKRTMFLLKYGDLLNDDR